MSKQKALLKSTLLLAVGKLSTQFVAFLLVPLYTFFLSPAEYGLVDLIVTYTILLAPAATLQMEMAVFRFLVDARDDEAEKKRIISNTVQIALASTVLLAVLFIGVNALVHIPHAGLILGLGMVTILLNLALQIARGLGKNKEFAFSSIAIALTNIVAAIGLVVIAKLGIAGVFSAMLLANTMGLLYVFFKLGLYKYISFHEQDRGLKRELVHYSLPLIPNSISWWVIGLFDRTIIAIFLGIAANGIYAVSSKYAAIFGSIFSIFGMSWTEAASMHINDKERQSFFSDVFNTGVRAFGALGLLLIVALPFVIGLVDKAYAEASLYVPLLIIAAFLNAIVGLYSGIYVARKMTRQVMTTSLIAAGINITLNFALISFIGLYAAAIATTAGYGAMAIYRHFDLKSFIRIDYDKRVLALLGLLYGGVIYLYYLNMPIVNILNVVIVIAAALLLNKKLVNLFVRKLSRGRIAT